MSEHSPLTGPIQIPTDVPEPLFSELVVEKGVPSVYYQQPTLDIEIPQEKP